MTQEELLRQANKSSGGYTARLNQLSNQAGTDPYQGSLNSMNALMREYGAPSGYGSLSRSTAQSRAYKKLLETAPKLPKEFEKRRDVYAAQEFSPLATQAQSNLKDLQRQIRQQANRRGLLYSGIREGQEAQAQGATAAELARARANINQGLLQEQQQLENIPVQLQMKNFQALLQQQASRQAQQEKDRALRQQGLQSIGKGIGYGFGTLAAKDKANPYELTSFRDANRARSLLGVNTDFGINYGGGLE